MNEVLTNENVEMEELVTENTEDYGTESNGGLGGLLAVSVCAVGALGAYLYKTRDKRKAKKEARMIKELESKGYTILDGFECDGDDTCGDTESED